MKGLLFILEETACCFCYRIALLLEIICCLCIEICCRCYVDPPVRVCRICRCCLAWSVVTDINDQLLFLHSPCIVVSGHCCGCYAGNFVGGMQGLLLLLVLLVVCRACCCYWFCWWYAGPAVAVVFVGGMQGLLLLLV